MNKLNLIKSLVSSNPSYLIMYITSKCNSKCKYCFYWKELNQKKKELSLEEIDKISRSFKNLAYISLTGGEPFLREDIDKICYLFHKNSNTQFIAIPTNGILFDKIKEKTESILRLCKGAHISIDISIDALGKKHDAIRGVPGDFSKAVRTIEYLEKLKQKYPNLKLVVHSVFSAYNQDYAKEVYDYFKSFEIDQHRFGLVRAEAKNADSAELSLEKYDKLLDYMEKNKIKTEGYSKIFDIIHQLNTEINLKTLKEDKMIIPCVAGKKMLIIGEEGDVYPCEILNKKLGNLREFDYDINNLLKSKTAKEIVNSIKTSKCHCTWGCATQNNIIFNYRAYPRIVYKLFFS